MLEKSRRDEAHEEREYEEKKKSNQNIVDNYFTQFKKVYENWAKKPMPKSANATAISRREPSLKADSIALPGCTITKKDIKYIKRMSISLSQKYNISPDILHDLFLDKFPKCFQLYNEVRGASFHTYLHRAFENACIDYIRRYPDRSSALLVSNPEEVHAYWKETKNTNVKYEKPKDYEGIQPRVDFPKTNAIKKGEKWVNASCLSCHIVFIINGEIPDECPSCQCHFKEW